jgi:hypothetical protein
LISTLRQYVEALGGRLDLVVRFDDGAKPLHIAGFADIAGDAEPQRKRLAADAKRSRNPSRPRSAGQSGEVLFCWRRDSLAR